MLSHLSEEATGLFIHLSTKNWKNPSPNPHICPTTAHGQRHDGSYKPHHVRDQILERTIQLQWSHPIPQHRVCCYQCEHPRTRSFHYFHVPTQDRNIIHLSFHNQAKHSNQCLVMENWMAIPSQILSSTGYLADSIKALEIQLGTCIDFLDLMTLSRGIANECHAPGLWYN